MFFSQSILISFFRSWFSFDNRLTKSLLGTLASLFVRVQLLLFILSSPTSETRLLIFNKLFHFDYEFILWIVPLLNVCLSDYLNTLQMRTKWNRPQRNFKVRDIVLVVDERTSRNLWPLGRITDVTPDSMGIVRSVKLKTATSILERPIHKAGPFVRKLVGLGRSPSRSHYCTAYALGDQNTYFGVN